jgi:hypothetical protein
MRLNALPFDFAESMDVVQSHRRHELGDVDGAISKYLLLRAPEEAPGSISECCDAG